MKRFILKTVYLSLPVLIVGVAFEIMLRNIPNDYQYKKKYLDMNSSQVETLILGSSHALYGLNPDYFSSTAFNASHVSQSLDIDFEILKKYQHNFENLETVILPISYFTLYSKLAEGPESWRVKNYTIYYGLHAPYSAKYHSEFLGNQLDVNIQRLFSYYWQGKSHISCDSLGWGTGFNSGNSRDLFETGRSAAKKHTKTNIHTQGGQAVFNNNISILCSIIQWCHEKKVKVLLLTPPAYKTYRLDLNPEQLNTTLKTARDVSTKFNNCFYLNLLNNSQFTQSDFYDADHLSDKGAEKLSIMVNMKINNIKFDANAQEP